MSHRPLLIFPQPSDETRHKLSGGGGRIVKPTAAQQKSRLDAKFRTIVNSFQSVQVTAQGIEPEQVLVLETVGASVDGLAASAAHVEGLEWLAEMDLADVEPMGGFADAKDPTKRLPCRLYAVMSNQQAMAQLLSLWDEWVTEPGRRATRYFGPFKDIFVHLKDIRRWSVEDRLEHTGVVEYWKDYLAHEQATVRFEVELWCRGDETVRERAYTNLSALIQQTGGRCIAQAAIPEIAYHGVLAEIGSQSLRATVDSIFSKDYSQLLRCEDIMFFRPFGQSAVAAPEEADVVPPPIDVPSSPLAAGDPVVALFDGLPLENHVLLAGRLLIDDPEERRRTYQPGQQRHGTAMASLLVHGDLSAPQSALTRSIYVRPIFVPMTDFRGRTIEVTPDDQLLVDLIHRCVRRLKEGEGDEGPVGPAVRIINLSLGNRFQPFDRELSPLARLLDWLAWKHKMLFIVSAGNHADNITITASSADWGTLPDEDLRTQTLRSMRDQQLQRRPLSPSEAINALTVGAIHADASTPPALDSRTDLLRGARLPSPVNTVASGFRRAVKPEVLLPGGRQFYRPPVVRSADPASFEIHDSIMAPGQLVAAPGLAPMELSRRVFCRGTSNATILTTRCAASVYERLMELRAEPGGDQIDEENLAVLIKALVVHGASWGSAAETLRSAFVTAGVNGRDLHRLQTRFLGYGEVDVERSQFASDQRATIIGWGRLAADKGHVFRIPLPPCLSASTEQRRLFVTLAWLTPINSRHKGYRQAHLWIDVPEEQLGVKTVEVDCDSARRGTVEHRVFEGRKASSFLDGEDLPVTVSCRDGAGRLAAEVPYGLAVTVEVAESINLPVYAEIRDRIRPRVEIQARNL